jgi:ankyrin repeat protein
MNQTNIATVLIFITSSILVSNTQGMECKRIPAPKDAYALGLMEINGKSLNQCYLTTPLKPEVKTSIEDLYRAEQSMNNVVPEQTSEDFVAPTALDLLQEEHKENPPLVIINAKKRKNPASETSEQDQTKRSRATSDSFNQALLNRLASNDELLIDYIHRGEVETIQAMIDSGRLNASNINKKILNQSLLHHALKSRKHGARIISALVKIQGITIDATNIKDSTPLHVACRINVEGVPALLAAGAQITIPNTQGNYPLHIAVSEGTKKTVAYLLNHGNSDQLTFRDKNGLTPLQLAQKKYSKVQGRWPIIELLKNAEKKHAQQAEDANMH